jgi:hypothetical protein
MKLSNYWVPHQEEEPNRRRGNMERGFIHAETYTTNKVFMETLVWMGGSY